MGLMTTFTILSPFRVSMIFRLKGVRVGAYKHIGVPMNTFMDTYADLIIWMRICGSTNAIWSVNIVVECSS